MSMLENWEKTSFSEDRRYYTKNESGSFYCDEAGRMTCFEPAEENCLHQGPHGFKRSYEKVDVRNLIIPAGIREITHDAEKLWDLVVVEKLVLPQSLEKLDANVLSGCLVMEMELPTSLREIGPGALMCNYIHVLRIPQGMPHPKYADWGQKKAEGALTVHGRQFKETIINTLIVPKGYPYKELMLGTKINNIVYSD